MKRSAIHLPTSFPAIIMGVFFVLCAMLGLLYNAMSAVPVLLGGMEPMLKEQNLPYFYQAFSVMSGLCISCYCILLCCGIDLIRSRLRCARLMTLVFLFEVAYFCAIGAMWLEPTIGSSVAAATGVANGGMMVQFMILLPFWAPAVLWWAKYRQELQAKAEQDGQLDPQSPAV